MTQNQLQSVFAYHKWRQRIPLDSGLETPGTNFAREWEMSYLPNDLSGKSFLDVGANDGMFSFLAEKKGATRVVATDIYTTTRNSHMTFGWNKTGIETAANLLQSKVDILDYSIYELDQIEGSFDFVFCSNVLAWLKDPLSALEMLASKTTQTLHLREDLSITSHGKPELRFVHDYQNPKATCFYNPNKEWFETVLRGLGFKQIEIRLIDEKDIVKHRQQQFAKYKIPNQTAIWNTPFDPSASDKTSESSEKRSTMEYHDFLFFPSLGWVLKKDCQFIPTSFEESGKLKSSIKKLMGKSEEWGQINFAIIAKR